MKEFKKLCKGISRPACVAAVAFVGIFCLKFAGEIFFAGVPEAHALIGGLIAVLSLAVLWGWGFPALDEGFTSLRKKHLAIEPLLALALILSLIVFSIECWLDIGGLVKQGIGYSLAIVIAFIAFFRILRKRLRGRIEAGLDFNPDGLSAPVNLISGHAKGDPDSVSVKQVNSSAVKADDIIQLGANCYVPCDGEVVWGHAVIEERRYSGYSVVKSKGIGSAVYAGSRIISGSLQLRVDSPLQESGLMGFVHEFRQRLNKVAQNSVHIEWVKRCSQWLLLMMSVTVIVLMLLKQGGVAEALQGAVAILMLAPLLTVFDIPLLGQSLIFSSAFRRGVLLQGLDSIEKLQAIRNLVVEYNSAYPPGRPEVIGYELIDRRVDQAALDRLLFTFFSQSDEELHRAATRYLQSKVHLKNFSFPELKDCCIHQNQGLVGTLDGVKLIIGAESFLIQQGVQVQPSDLVEDKDGEVSLYIAVQDAIIARLRLGAVFMADGEALVENLRKLKVRTVLVSRDPSEHVDKIGKRIGLELSDVHAGLPKLQLEETVGKIVDVGFYAQPESDPRLYRDALATMSVFDPVRFEVGDQEATVFTRELDVVYQILKTVKTSWSLLQSYSYYFVVVSGLSLGVAVSIGLPPVITAAIGFGAAFLTWSRLSPLVVKL